MTTLEDRIITDLWKKYHKARSSFAILEQDIDSLKGSIAAREKDKEIADYWVTFYRIELKARNQDVSEE